MSMVLSVRCVPLRCMLWVCLAWGLMFLGGCSLLGYIDHADSREVLALAQLPFPSDVPQGNDVTIKLSRDGIYIQLVNFSARSFEDVYIWLNQQYVAHLSQIKIGKNEPLTLRQFINRHGESFPVGAFLAPQKARPIISADLYDPQTAKRYPLVVRFADN